MNYTIGGRCNSRIW